MTPPYPPALTTAAYPLRHLRASHTLSADYTGPLRRPLLPPPPQFLMLTPPRAGKTWRERRRPACSSRARSRSFLLPGSRAADERPGTRTGSSCSRRNVLPFGPNPGGRCGASAARRERARVTSEGADPSTGSTRAQGHARTTVQADLTGIPLGGRCRTPRPHLPHDPRSARSPREPDGPAPSEARRQEPLPHLPATASQTEKPSPSSARRKTCCAG